MTTGAAKLAWEHSRAQNGSLLVLMAIAFEIEGKGNCIMTVAELAGKARLSERAVQAATADLTGLGELTVSRRAEGHRNGYSLSLLRGAESAPLPASSPAESAPRKICTPQILHPSEPKQAGQVRGAESAGLEISDILLTVTGSSLVEVKETPAKPPSLPDRPDVERLCARLADRIAANGSKRPVISRKWRDAARLLIDKDGRTEEQVSACIDWSQDDEFWRGNIMSMPTLREKYDRLRLDAIRKMKAAQGKSTRQPSDTEYNELRRIARALDEQEAAR
jgi:hypothetical protein